MNHEKWFRTFKFKAQSKGYFYVAETSKKSFAWVKFADRTVDNKKGKENENTVTASATPGSDSEIDNLASRLENMGGYWNVDKVKIFDQDTAKFFSHLTECLGDDDQEVFEEYESAKKIWNHLKSKYNRSSESTTSTYISKIQGFPDNFDIESAGIEKAWAELNSYKRKLIAADSTMRGIYPEKALFLILSKTLPSRYSSIIDGFRTNPLTTIEDRINILLEKEDSLKISEHAHSANKNYRSRQVYRNSDSSVLDIVNEILCYRCDGDDHVSRDCPFATEIKEFGFKEIHDEEFCQAWNCNSKGKNKT
ncbi:hypothetical protein GcM3_013053 [Golovinomyces cichoracearum]|uniref:CCHC-type domain-containing protein n=1 Tax=Golovinomyces cichoracearum TaxID=62708 RepID=A0A420J9K1_9PEZI|nr:hypothetical protein GcM3_013053 [Golovinomyces cichoracearum]